jgi:hypothetical protein
MEANHHNKWKEDPEFNWWQNLDLTSMSISTDNRYQRTVTMMTTWLVKVI